MSEIKTEIEQEFERAIAEIENDLTTKLSYLTKIAFKIIKKNINIESKNFWLDVEIYNITNNRSFTSNVVLNEIANYPFKHSYLYGWESRHNKINFCLTNLTH